jgi:sporulation protein YlmC with PRC-barrel domain
MRIGELLRSSVVDADGHDLGSVNDVRLVQDGPYVEGFGVALRVDALVVGPGSVAVRLGYHRHQVKGPALLRLVFGAIDRRAHYVPWDDVEAWDGSTVTLRVRRHDLDRVGDRG